MFNERTAQDTRRQIAEKIAKMDEEQGLLRKMLADVDAWLILNGIAIGEQMLPLRVAAGIQRTVPLNGTGRVGKGSLRELFVRIVETEGQRGLSARQVWEIAAKRGASSDSKKPERAAAAALGALQKRGVIRVNAGKFYPRERTRLTETTEAQAPTWAPATPRYPSRKEHVPVRMFDGLPGAREGF